jgi:hypothetical protein
MILDDHKNPDQGLIWMDGALQPLESLSRASTIAAFFEAALVFCRVTLDRKSAVHRSAGKDVGEVISDAQEALDKPRADQCPVR